MAVQGLAREEEGAWRRTHLGIPDAHLKRAFFDSTKKDWVGPRPLVHDDKEAAGSRRGSKSTAVLPLPLSQFSWDRNCYSPRDNASRTSFGIKLTDSSDQHCPGDTTTESHHVAINCSAWRFRGSKSVPIIPLSSHIRARTHA